MKKSGDHNIHKSPTCLRNSLFMCKIYAFYAHMWAGGGNILCLDCMQWKGKILFSDDRGPCPPIDLIYVKFKKKKKKTLNLNNFKSANIYIYIYIQGRQFVIERVSKYLSLIQLEFEKQIAESTRIIRIPGTVFAVEYCSTFL